jgi:hypothetical protein
MLTAACVGLCAVRPLPGASGQQPEPWGDRPGPPLSRQQRPGRRPPPSADLDRAADVGGGAAGNLHFHAVGCCRAGRRRVRRPRGPWLDPAGRAGGRADRRRTDLEITQELGLGCQGRCAGSRDPHHHQHPAAAGPDRRDGRAASPLVATPAGRLDGPHRPLGPPGRPRIRRPQKEPGRTDPQPSPGVGRSRGRRERGTGNRAGLEAPAGTGGRGRAGPVCDARRCPATGATRRWGTGAATARAMATT